jgi:hypothetical protein
MSESRSVFVMSPDHGVGLPDCWLLGQLSKGVGVGWLESLEEFAQD